MVMENMKNMTNTGCFWQKQVNFIDDSSKWLEVVRSRAKTNLQLKHTKAAILGTKLGNHLAWKGQSVRVKDLA